MKKLSIVIACLNEEDNIKNVLQRIRDFEIKDFVIEIVVVDNGSTDSTVTISREFTDKVYILPSLTISQLRNYGVQMATGEYIGFIDADCLPCRSWGKSAIDILDKYPKIGVVGNFYSIPDEATKVEKLWYLIRETQTGKVSFLPAGNCAVRRSNFCQIGGFSGELQTGEDYDLCIRYQQNEFDIYKNPEMISIHLGNAKNFRDIFRREVWYGQSMASSIKLKTISKPLIASVFWILGIAIFLLFFIYEFFSAQRASYLLIISFLFLIIPPLLYAIIATWRSKKVKNFIQYFIIFSFYIAGRVVSLLYCILGKKKRLK